MKLETKRLLLFEVLITMTTSLYVTFLGTYLSYGFRPGFLAKWLGSVPRAYLVVLPYIHPADGATGAAPSAPAATRPTGR